MIIIYHITLGKPGVKSSAVVTVDVGKDGEVNYDSIVKQGSNRDKIVHTGIDALKEKEGDRDAQAMPREEEENETADKTKAALETLLNGKIAKAKPNNASAVAVQNNQEAEYIRYSANPDAPGYNPELKNRVIRMVEVSYNKLTLFQTSFKPK